jgi:predicted nucleic acid-binding protein
VNYFDTSAFIKAFLIEAGTDNVQHLLLHDGIPATATITYTEMYSGFSRTRREGGLTAIQYETICKEFESFWPSSLQISLTLSVLTLSRDLITRHPLRAFDAIHLASALHIQEELKEPMRIIAADGRLLQAAAAEQLAVLNIKQVKDIPG